MSHSPDVAAEPDREYVEAWGAIYELIRQGKSWSGRERNCAFLNTGDGRFADLSAAAGLDYADDGRGLAVVDWDQDGRLDFWVSNRTGPKLRLLRNQGAGGGAFVALELEGRTVNRDAIGARVELFPAGRGDRLVRWIHAGDAYLAQSSKTVHFGLGAPGAGGPPAIDQAVVRWPGGGEETFRGLAAGKRYRLVEGSGRGEELAPRGAVELTPAEVAAAPPDSRRRTWLASRVPAHDLAYFAADGQRTVIDAGGRAVLVNLWASWCPNCRAELEEFEAARGKLRRADLEVLALTVDAEETRGEAVRFLEEIGWSSGFGLAPEGLVELLGILRRAASDLPGEMVVPTSFLLDGKNRLTAIYRGPVDLETLLADARAARGEGEASFRRAFPLPGRWVGPPPGRDLELTANLLRSRGFPTVAAKYLADLQPVGTAPQWARDRRLETELALAQALAGDGRHDEAIAAFRRLLDRHPEAADAHEGLANSLMALERPEEALAHHDESVRLAPGDAGRHFNRALALLAIERLPEGEASLAEAIRLSRPEDEARYLALYNLAVLRETQGRRGEAFELLRQSLALEPGHFDAQRFLGILHHRDGRLAEAIASYRKALALDPHDARTVFYLGEAYVASGDRQGAEAQLEKLKELKHLSVRRLAREIDEMEG